MPDLMDALALQSKGPGRGPTASPPTMDLMDSLAKNYKPNSPDSGVSIFSRDNIIDMLRPLIAGGAGAVAGGVAGASSLVDGPLGVMAAPVAATGAYGLTDQLLQRMRSSPSNGLLAKSVGAEPGSFSGDTLNSIEQFLAGKAIEGGLGVIGSGVKKLTGIDKLKSLNPEAMKYQPTSGNIMGGPAAFIEKTFAPGALQDAEQNSAKLGAKDASQFMGPFRSLDTSQSSLADSIQNKVASNIGDFEDNLPPSPIPGKSWSKSFINLVKQGPDTPEYQLYQDLTKGDGSLRGLLDTQSNPSPLINRIVDDPKLLGRALSSGELVVSGQKIATENLRKDLADYQFSRMMQSVQRPDGTYDIQSLLNPNAGGSLLTSDTNSKTAGMLWSKDTRQNINDFLNAFQTSQSRPPNSGALSLYAARGAVMVPMALLSHSLGLNFGGLEYPASMVAAKVGLGQLGKWLTKPETAQLMVKLANGQSLGFSTSFASKLLVNGLNGAYVSLVDSQGKETPGQVEDGTWTSTSPTNQQVQ